MKRSKGSCQKSVLKRHGFIPAVSLMESKSGPLRRFADRLLGAAKKPACVVGALMCKLSVIIFAILRSGKPFDPHYTRTAAIPGAA